MYSLEESENLLSEFLSLPLDSADSVFDYFHLNIPEAQYIKGEKERERFLYLKGDRKDRVLLVAHADTVWDFTYINKKAIQKTEKEQHCFKGTNPEYGIGADDRAGCAMLYALKESGHSLLIMDSEEYHKTAHQFLIKKHKKLLRELNRHQYMLEIDLMGAGLCSSSRIANTKKFEAYIKSKLSLKSTPKLDGLGTDISILCKNICGMNISCGYSSQHTGKETLDTKQWHNTLCQLEAFLGQPHNRFKTDYVKRIKRLAKRIKDGVLRRIRK